MLRLRRLAYAVRHRAHQAYCAQISLKTQTTQKTTVTGWKSQLLSAEVCVFSEICVKVVEFGSHNLEATMATNDEQDLDALDCF